ncbi:MAG: hypothetical protein CBC82_10240 [Cellvibrionales bacterium TMED122]|nr:MAG: hypothetical protein CBC82_10240 [Cellvibrionales bacterium TMED122]
MGGNPGILGCLFGLAGDYEEFDEIWTKNAHAWNHRVADFLVEHAAFSESTASNMAFALGAMTEGFLYQVYIRHTNDLESFSGSSNSIAELIATLWYRTIFLKNPPERSASRVARRISQSEDN